MRAIVFADRFLHRFAAAAGNIDHHSDVAAVHDRKKFLGRSVIRVHVIFGPGEMAVDIDDRKSRALHPRGGNFQHALGLEVGEIERRAGPSGLSQEGSRFLACQKTPAFHLASPKT